MLTVETDAPRTARQFTSVLRILESFDHDRSKLVPILQEVQDEYRYLPEEVMTFVATALDIPPARVYGVATFYSHFALEPKGKYVISVCMGTACYVKCAQAVLDKLASSLGVEPGETTKDGKFTLVATRCLGACGLAPVLTVDEDVHGRVTPDDVPMILSRYED